MQVLSASVIGTCDLELGPHLFLGTSFSTVSLGPEHASAFRIPAPAPFTSYQSHPLRTADHLSPISSSGLTFSNTLLVPRDSFQDRNQPLPIGATSGHPATTLQSYATSSTQSNAPGTSLALESEPSAQLFANIEAASADDPEFQRLLSVAADGSATEAELSRLALCIEGLSNQAPKPLASGSLHSRTAGTTSAEEKDAAIEIILTFKENPSESFVLPLSNSIVERRIVNAGVDPITGRPLRTLDILISTIMPFDVDPSIASHARHPVTLTLSAAPPALWRAISERVAADDGQLHEPRTTSIGRYIKDSVSRVHLLASAW